MNDDIKTVVEKCRLVLADHYKEHFAGLVVYGSVARGRASKESDIDILVLLNRPFDYFNELWTVVDLLYATQLEYRYLISARPALLEEFEQGAVQLYRNAQREGIRV